MNLREFIEQLESVLDVLNKDQLKEVILGIAKFIPQNNREKYIETIYELSVGKIDKLKTTKSDFKDHIPEMITFIEDLSDIDSILVYPTHIYDSETEEYLETNYSLDSLAMEIITSALVFFDKVYDEEDYKEAVELARALINLRLLSAGEGEPEDFILRDLYSFGILTFDFEKFLHQFLVSIYYYEDNPEKYDDLLDVLLNGFLLEGFSLKELLDLEDLDVDKLRRFTEGWLEFLSDQAFEHSELLELDAQDVLTQLEDPIIF